MHRLTTVPDCVGVMTSASVSPTVHLVASATLPGGGQPMDHNSSSVEPPSSSEDYVFVSYARADEKIARATIKIIEGAGFRVWWDGLIPSGERFSAKIGEALEGAKAVVVLWSASSDKSNWVQDEAA